MSQSSPDSPSPSTATLGSDPLIGKTLDGRYVVERILGAGGMGLVYQARHVVLGKALAIKVLKQEVSRDEQVMGRFRREAQSASAIGSAHICAVSDFGSLPDGSTYFVMEYLDGPSLTKAMEQDRPMAAARILSIGVQLCDALGAAHESGIVHRDLKPDNVHLVRHGSKTDFVKVLDFGIAKVGGAADKKLTQAGQVFGTPHYMSPEQCSGGDVDHRTDVYALGVMLYEMAAGQVPFDADNLMGVLTKHVYEQPIPPRELPKPADVPADLEAVILKALAKSPDERYASMAALREDLARVQGGIAPLASTESMLTSRSGDRSLADRSLVDMRSPIAAGTTPAPLAQKSGKGVWIAAALSLVLVGVGVAAGVFFMSESADERPQTPRASRPPATPPVPTPPPSPTPEPPPVPPAPEPPPPVAPEAPTMVRLVTEPAGAEVYSSEGALIGNTPLELPRPAVGVNTSLTIRLPSYAERSFIVSSLTAGEVLVTLERQRLGFGGPRRSPTPMPTPVPMAPPTPRPLAPTYPPPRPRPSTGSSEIIDPF
jgi:serine/threonine-protein kinase